MKKVTCTCKIKVDYVNYCLTHGYQFGNCVKDEFQKAEARSYFHSERSLGQWRDNCKKRES